MKRERTVNNSIKYMIMGVVFIMTLIVLTQTTVLAAKSKSYSLVVSGAGTWNGDKDGMVKILQKNTLFLENSVYTFCYDTDTGGTRKDSYQKAIDTAYRNCTKNDTAFFFHSGHGMEGLTKGMGILLKNSKKIGNDSIPLSWYGYKELLNKLGSVNCKHMVVIIHACESGAVQQAYNKLSADKKNKISLFWSSKKNEPSYKNESLPYSVYGQAVIQMMGYNGEIGGDQNKDGVLTVTELGVSINGYIDKVSEYHKVPSKKYQTPGYCSEKNKNTPIYSLASANSGLGKIKTPQIKKIDNSKQNKIEITWDKISGVSGYVIYTSNTKKIKYTKCKTIKGSLSKTIINIGNGKSMYVKIRALKKKNGKYVYSGFSNAKKVTEIGGVWYQKVLKSKNGRYNVQRCFGQDLQKCIANRNEFTYYQVTDINKDGIKELILHSDINSPYDGNYILLLTYYNNKVKPLLYAGGSGKRGGYYISGKNFIVKMGGSDFYYLGYFTIKAGKLVVTRQLQYTMEKNRTEYKEICYYNKRKITYTEYSNLRQKYNTNGLKEISFKQITV